MNKIECVCLIEDDPIVVLLMRKFLEKTGKAGQFVSYQNGKEAYDNLKDKFEKGDPLPELIFLDINMPVWDGWNFLSEFIKLPLQENIIIYILTSSTSPEDLSLTKKYGLQDRYILKPMSFEKLNKILNSI
ncbi:MAG: response regulator [Balneolaceae bacterium]|nr:MAG: response regulator [Balneolaceae bacterium]